MLTARPLFDSALAELKSEMKEMKAQMEVQLEAQKAQIEAQKAQMEAQTEELKAQMQTETTAVKSHMTRSAAVHPTTARDLDSGKTVALSDATSAERMGAMKAAGTRRFAGMRGFFSGKKK